MIVECSQCGDRKYFPEPVPYGRKYVCRKCRTVLILPNTEKTPKKSVKKNGMLVATHQALIVLVAALIVISSFGSSIAAAKTPGVPQTPLEGILAVLSGAPADSNLLENVQEVAAQYERSVVTESLQWMRIIEKIRNVPPVTEPTNDMERFPSLQNPLYPEYLSWKYSQFKYTVDRYGIINSGTSNSSGIIYQ